jgi:hypothetical protein
LDFAKNMRRGWDSNPRDASRRLAVFQDGLDSEARCAFGLSVGQSAGQAARLGGIKPVLSSFKTTSSLRALPMRERPSGRFSFGAGGPWRKQTCQGSQPGSPWKTGNGPTRVLRASRTRRGACCVHRAYSSAESPPLKGSRRWGAAHSSAGHADRAWGFFRSSGIA